MRNISLPVKVNDKTDKQATFEMATYQIMYPHEIIAFLYKSGLKIDKKDIQTYWRTSRANKEPWAVFSKASEAHVPLGFYGDGATITTKYGKQESVVGLFMNLVLWSPQSVRSSRFLLCCIEEAALWKWHTLTVILREIVWSYNLLDSGFHPSMMLNGEAVPPDMLKKANTKICEDGTVFSVTEIRGDWSWMKKIFRFRASWQGNYTCHQCAAKSVGPYTERYYNFESASWDVNPGGYELAEFLNTEMPSVGICHWHHFQYHVFKPKVLGCSVGGHVFLVLLLNHCTMTSKHVASPANHSGPLIALKNFSPTVVRWCMMHVVHLGILYVCNGACLTFDCTKIRHSFPMQVHPGWISMISTYYAD